jgi:hypothetical protein
MQAFKHRPELTKALASVLQISANGERRLSAYRYQDLPRTLLQPLCLRPPTFPRRAIQVYRCGFRGLQTARAVMRISPSCQATNTIVYWIHPHITRLMWLSPMAPRREQC